MKRSFLLAALLALAFAFAISWRVVSDAAVCAYRVVRAAGDWLTAKVLGFAAKLQPAADRPLVGFVVAKAFVLRVIKRDRPVFFAGWRMCPSI
jgi:hypothetical protein